ncbi:MAG: hypothetical protein JNG82_11310 [Opitutaceae bacterium]|nr:hypothetical protein [Opitutaceae bacterium]
MDAVEQRERILEDAHRAVPAGRQVRLAPHREAVLIYRARGFSYEQIAAALNRLGLQASPTNVGLFCRRHFRKADIQRKRLELETAASVSGTPVPAPTPRVPSFISGRRGGRS